MTTLEPAIGAHAIARPSVGGPGRLLAPKTQVRRYPGEARKRAREPDPLTPRHIWIRQHQLPNLPVEVVAGGDELAQGAARRRERVELAARQPSLRRGAPE